MEPEIPSRPPSAMDDSVMDSESVAPSLSNFDGETVDGYKYRDFSTMPEDKQEASLGGMVAIDEAPRSSNSSGCSSGGGGNLDSSIRVQKFPVKLYAILAQKEFHNIITWMPHGRSWKVLQPNLFESMVMPLFFEYSNYHSFNRLVNAWSFRRISSGPDRGSYYHELFLRGKPHLQKYMRRLPKTHKKLPMKKENEPDFYAMDLEKPLPSLEEIVVPSMVSIQKEQPNQHQQRNPEPAAAASLPAALFPDAVASAGGRYGILPSIAAMSQHHQHASNLFDLKRQVAAAASLNNPINHPASLMATQLHQLQILRQLQQKQQLERQVLASQINNPFMSIPHSAAFANNSRSRMNIISRQRNH